MGKRLIIKGADFSTNAIPPEELSTLIRAGYNGTSTSLNGWRYNSLAVSKKTTITAVSIILKPSVLTKEKYSVIMLAAYDGVNSLNGISKIVVADVSSVVNKMIDEGITSNTKYIIPLPKPLVLEIGEYFAYSIGDDSTLYNSTYTWSTSADGTYGYMGTLDNNILEGKGESIGWYGFEEE